MKKNIYILLAFCFIFWPIVAQEEDNFQQDVNVDDLGNVTDQFQEYFFEALKQKGIENYDKAIVALNKCKEIDPLPAVFFELGKNYKALENYEAAIENLLQAKEEKPNNPDILAELYEVYHAQKDYNNAIEIVKQLIPNNSNLKEDLANLYLLTGQYTKSLEVLDELDAQLGNSEYRDTLRRRIYEQNNDEEARITLLKKKIEEDPNNEENYLNLIFIYSESGAEELAFETAKTLININPDSELAHLALYKFYLDQNKLEEAINSMKIVLKSDTIDAESQLKVLNDFLLFVNQNEQFLSQLKEVVDIFAQKQGNALVYQKLGDYFLTQEDVERALYFFELGLKEEPDNPDLIKQTILLNLDAENYDEARNKSEMALEFFPSQPLFYLLNAVAQNYLGAFSEAEEMLLIGLDYLIDNPKMKADFYKQLSIAYKGLGKTEKANEYEQKLLQSN